MPAASWPRCCSACRPSAVIAAASGWPKMPNTPHSSRRRSASGSKTCWSAFELICGGLSLGRVDQLFHVGAVGPLVALADRAGDVGSAPIGTLARRRRRVGVFVLRAFLEHLREISVHVLRQQGL